MKNTILLSLACIGTLQVGAQNACSTAMPVTPGTYVVGSIDGAISPVNCTELQGTNTVTAAEWYAYTATEDGLIRVSSNISGQPIVDTRLHIYTGVCGSLTCHAGNDDNSANQSSTAIFEVSEDVTYYIVFDNRWSNSGFTFELGVYATPPTPMVHFTPTSIGLNGTSRAVVDMNGDHLDDVVGVTATNVNIFQQQAGGGLVSVNIPTTQAQNTPSWSLAAGDIDGNGYNDLMYGGGSGATFMMANNTGTGFTQTSFPQYIFCQRTNMVDINNDGHLDAFSCHDVDANVGFMNDGNGVLTFTQGGFGTTCGNYGSVWIDYDNDGDMDCFVAKCGCDPVDLLLRNNGDGSFTNVAAELGFADNHQSWSSAWGDFDNDGDMDVLVGASSSGYHKLMRNNGNNSFTNVTLGSGVDLYNGQSIEWTTHDFNNDGYLDILGGGGMLVNQGNLTFAPEMMVPPNGSVGDLNNDGFLDIVNGNTIQFNDGNDNNWIKVNTIGTVSNRNGIGARVMVTSALGTQIRDVKSGDGFRYMSSLTTHFGIRENDEVERIEVRWPSGIVDIIENPGINTTINVVENLNTVIAERVVTELMIYPVPANDQLTVSGAHASNGGVRVIDITGKEVIRTNLIANKLNVSDLRSGYYLLQVEGAEGKAQRSFTKQ